MVELFVKTAHAPLGLNRKSAGSLLAAVLLIFFSAGFTTAFGETYTLQPSPGANDNTDRGTSDAGMDTWYYKHLPDDNYGDEETIYNTWNDGDGCYNDDSSYSGLIRFDFSDAGLPQTATSAKVMLYVKQAVASPDGSLPTDLYELTADWNEMDATWNNRPSLGNKVASATILDNTPGWAEWDITEFYNQVKSGQKTNYGFEIYTFTCTANATCTRVFYSSDYSDDPTLRPKLVVEGEGGGTEPGGDETPESLADLIETSVTDIIFSENEYPLLAVPDAFGGWDSFARLDNVLGDDVDDLFATSRLYVDGNKVRIKDIRVGDDSYWCDLELSTAGGGLAYVLRNFTKGWPDTAVNGLSMDPISFMMAEADLTGPPLSLVISGVLLKNKAFEVTFTYAKGKFQYTGIRQMGELYNLDGLYLITQGESPALTGSSVFKISGAQYNDMFAFVHTGDQNGENYFDMTYEFGTISQPLMIRDGWAIGHYLDEEGATGFSAYDRGEFSAFSFFKKKTTREKLTEYIQKEAKAKLTLGHESKLTEALMELGESMASELKLSSKTAAKFKEVVMDNKEALIQAVSSGSVKPETILQQLSTNFLKHATTEEQEDFVKLYFDGKMPEHQANIIETIQDAKEKNFKAAAAAFSSRLLKAFFPRTMAAARTLRELTKYSGDLWRDYNVAELYKMYKSDHPNTFTCSYFTNLWEKLHKLLDKKGIPYTHETAEAYLKGMFDMWKAQEEEELPILKEKLDKLMEEYLALSASEKKYLIPDGVVFNPSDIERFKKFVALYDNIYAYMKAATAGCSAIDETMLTNRVVELVKLRFLAFRDKSTGEFHYRQNYMGWLKTYGCIDKVVERKIDEARLQERLLGMETTNFIGVMENLDGTSILDCLCDQCATMCNGSHYTGNGPCHSSGLLSSEDHDLIISTESLKACHALDFVSEKLLQINQ